MDWFCYYRKVMITKNNVLESNLEEMAAHGVHLGTLKSNGHPKMKSYIWSNKNVFQIIDLEQSTQDLKKAIDFLVEAKKKGNIILFVGTGFAAKEITRKVAEDLKMPYVTERWLGGTFTNFPTINRRIEYLRTLESQKAAGEFEKYTKYEISKLEEKIMKLRKNLGGLIDMRRLPDAIWVSSANYDRIAVTESVKKKIPVIGLVNTNADPTAFSYPIPANDNSLNSVNFMLNQIRDALIGVEVSLPTPTETETNDKN